MKLSYSDYKKYSASHVPEVYFNYLFLQFANPIGYLLLRIGVPPNQITYSSISASVFGGISIYLGFPIVGMSFFILSYLLDFCDEVTRAQNSRFALVLAFH